MFIQFLRAWPFDFPHQPLARPPGESGSGEGRTEGRDIMNNDRPFTQIQSRAIWARVR